MWSFSRNIYSFFPTVRSVVVLVLALVLLAACGSFRPLYATRAGGEATAALDLARTYIVPIEDRMGQQLHNGLLDLMNPRGRPTDPTYVLSVQLGTSTDSTGIAKSSYATRASLSATASFTLADAATNKTLLAGSRRIVTGYDILDSEYATLVAEKDAEARAARELAHGIQNQIAVYFLQQAEKSPPR